MSAGLGFEYYDAPSLAQYLDYAAPGTITPGTYTTAAQFDGSLDYTLPLDWSIGVELGYITKSASVSGQIGSEQVNYSYLMPLITVRRVVTGEGYFIRFGGGIGYHFAYLDQTSPYSSQAASYSAHGIGLKFDAQFDTKLSDNLYARIDGEARSELTGYLRDASGNTLTYIDASSNPHPVDTHLSGVGIIFGLVYYF